jgi:hypothetical protein
MIAYERWPAIVPGPGFSYRELRKLAPGNVPAMLALAETAFGIEIPGKSRPAKLTNAAVTIAAKEGMTTPQEIIDALTVPARLPVAALDEATERRDELLPVFLAEVERWLVEEEEPEVPTALFYLFHLFAGWREPRAYRLLARVLRADPERLEWELGDATTETAPRVMAAVFDGDVRPICDIIEDPDADEFVRCAMFGALGGLVCQGKLARESLVAYLARCPGYLAAPPGSAIWGGWVSLVGDLKLRELEPVAKRVFAEGLVAPLDMRPADLQRKLDDPTNPSENRQFQPFGDLKEELSSWAWFDEGEDYDDETLERELAEIDDLGSEPVTNPFRRVGRNDPCPCGSGKKFKRCCGQSSAT